MPKKKRACILSEQMLCHISESPASRAWQVLKSLSWMKELKVIMA